MALTVHRTTKSATGRDISVYAYDLAEFHEDSENSTGVCLACGETQGQTEPDARRYKCESCGAMKVYGLEEALLMGRIQLVDDDGETEASENSENSEEDSDGE